MGNNNTKQIWKPLSFEGLSTSVPYKISDLGNIRKYDNRTKEWQDVKLVFSRKIFVCFFTSNKKGQQISKPVHRLVADTFLQQPSPLHKFVIHLDYDKTNNDVENLKWVTQDELTKHQKGEPNYMERKMHNVKLSVEDVKAIKKALREPDVIYSQLAKKYKVSVTQIDHIRYGQNWSHISIDE